LNHASAITLGLILNEAITNAIKYAFSKTEDAKIAISLTHISDSQLLLSISGNGSGLPSDFNRNVGASMGVELLQGLMDDMGGSFSIENNEGTHIKIIFTYKAINTSHRISESSSSDYRSPYCKLPVAW
jgi:two-component sensor histidine kinase